MPLPAISSNANHKACITNTNNTTKKVANKGCKKLFKIYLSNILSTVILVQKSCIFFDLCILPCQK